MDQLDAGRDMIAALNTLRHAVYGTSDDPDAPIGEQPLAAAQRATAAAPNGPTKHLALGILTQLQINMAALSALLDNGALSVGIASAPTAQPRQTS